MWVAPCSWRTRISLILESTSASKIGIAAPPDRPNTYSTPSRSRQRISFSAPLVTLCSWGAAFSVLSCVFLEGVYDGAVFSERVATVSLLLERFRNEVDKARSIWRSGQHDLGRNCAGLAKSTTLTR